MTDRINIKNLEIFARHGALPEENVLGQKFIISLSLSLSLREAGKTDNLEKTLDYSKLCNEIKAFVEDKPMKLIETVAEGLSSMLLVENPIISELWLEIKKPWAPIAMHLETVSVEIVRKRHRAFIALGSNMGEREKHLSMAVSELDGVYGCRVLQTSDFHNTPPYGVTDQADFLNACLELETLHTPQELLEILHRIEKKAGRVREQRWGPRTLDLDIIFYDDLILSETGLRIPHVDMQYRDFVLSPLNEIAPDVLHPLIRKSVAELLDELQKSKIGVR